jgi:DNA-binding MarR family transcriptional regulator
MDLSIEHGVNFQNSLSSSFFTQEQQSLELLQSSPTVSFYQALTVVNNIIFTEKNRSLTKPEIAVLKGAWENQDFSEIGQQSGYKAGYLQRRIAPQLWNLLSETVTKGQQVLKRKVRTLLTEVVINYYQSNPHLELPLFDSQFIKGQLPSSKLSNFYGRQQELYHLKKLINNHRCISLAGVPGVGKTALSAKLLAELSLDSTQHFDFLVWKSVTHSVRLQDLLSELIDLIEPDTSLNLPEYTQALITGLIKHLQSHRCLLVLDGFEVLFKTPNLEQRLDYKIFMRRLLEEEHKSCVLLTCRALPNEIHAMSKDDRSILYFRVDGLDTDAALNFLSDQGLTNKNDCLDLIKTYRSNPSELATVVQKIKHFFSGSTEIFFKNKTTFITDEFQSMLDETFGESLEQTERYIMIYLAQKLSLDPAPISFSDLLIQLNSSKNISASTSAIIKALEKLEQLSLIESIKDPNTKEIAFTLQPVVKKYINTDPLGLVKSQNSFPSLANAF